MNRKPVCQWLFFAALVVITGHATAQSISDNGNELFDALTHRDEGVKVATGFFVLGITEGFQVGLAMYRTRDSRQNLPCFDIPKDVKGKQVVDIVKRYLDEHPEKRHEPSPVLIIRSVSLAFPCFK